jgi:hypothetical protein
MRLFASSIAESEPIGGTTGDEILEHLRGV